MQGNDSWLVFRDLVQSVQRCVMQGSDARFIYRDAVHIARKCPESVFRGTSELNAFS